MTRAAAFLTQASALTNSGKCASGRPEIGKFSMALCIWVPQMQVRGNPSNVLTSQAGTRTSGIGWISIRAYALSE